MKKFFFAFAVLLFVSQTSALSLGLEYKASYDNTVALNIGITDQFELKPQLGFQLGDNPWMNLILDGNLYLSDMGNIRHYVGFGLTFTNSSFLLGGHYGLRYNINDVVSIFGEIGVMMDFDPEFTIFTSRPGLGCTFYLPAFN